MREKRVATGVQAGWVWGVSLGLALLMTSGCSSIWNAGDLAVWVKDQAEEQGCVRETISLEEWYVPTDEGNVWRGTCRDAQDASKSFGINVDSVWTPSETAK